MVAPSRQSARLSSALMSWRGARLGNGFSVGQHAFDVKRQRLGPAPERVIYGVAIRDAAGEVGKADAESGLVVVKECHVTHLSLSVASTNGHANPTVPTQYNRIRVSRRSAVG